MERIPIAHTGGTLEALLPPRIRNLVYGTGELVRELIRTNDRVLLSFAESLLRDAGIPTLMADTNMSVLEGSIGVFPQRLLVDSDSYDQACRLLRDADLGQWIKSRD